MDHPIFILVIDDNIELRNLLEEYFSQCEGMNVIGTGKDGIEAIQLIKELSPDVVILDLIMPNLDGIGVLEKMPQMNLKHRPLFIILTALGQDIFIQKAMALGADYYILKPFDIDMLGMRIRQIFNEAFAVQEIKKTASRKRYAELPGSERKDLAQVVTNFIIEMGIPPNIAGYSYLREAVMLAIEQPLLSHLVTKHIYQSIAAKHNTKAGNVSKAIRGVIYNAHKKDQHKEASIWDSIINLNHETKTTNAKVITFLANKARDKMKTMV